MEKLTLTCLKEQELSMVHEDTTQGSLKEDTMMVISRMNNMYAVNRAA